MNLYELLENLGFDPDSLNHYQGSEEAERLMEMEIEIHQQPSYPLAADCRNVREFYGKLAIASGEATRYGSKEAWEEEW